MKKLLIIIAICCSCTASRLPTQTTQPEIKEENPYRLDAWNIVMITGMVFIISVAQNK